MMCNIEDALVDEKPDVVLVYGDTNTTLAATLAAVKLGLPVAHVEAGMRSYNFKAPEEINRIVTDHCSKILLCATVNSVNNLKKEGKSEEVHLVGDVMYDTYLKYSPIAESRFSRFKDDYGISKDEYVLFTIHRASNVDTMENFIEIVRGVVGCGLKIIWPVHPRCRPAISNFKEELNAQENLIMIDPVGYIDMLSLETFSNRITTDSGGVQKEAYFCRKPCITFRSDTEWPETISDGFNILVECNSGSISKAISEFEISGNYSNHFGDGKSAKAILKILFSLYG